MSENLSNDPMGEETARSHNNAPWIAGVALILLGLFFLLQNVTGFSLGNWWALFILIPAVGSLTTAWRAYQAHGRVTGAVRGPLIGGLVLLFVTAMFLFGLDWGRLWPVFLILGGLGALMETLGR